VFEAERAGAARAVLNPDVNPDAEPGAGGTTVDCNDGHQPDGD